MIAIDVNSASGCSDEDGPSDGKTKPNRDVVHKVTKDTVDCPNPGTSEIVEGTRDTVNVKTVDVT